MDYRFILGKTTPGAHRKTIAGLSQVLGVSENLAGKLVRGAPISLFSELTLVQAQALLAVFAPLADAGALFSVEAGDNSLSTYGYVGWPRTPTIHGTPLENLTLAEKPRPLPRDEDIQVTPARPLPPAKPRQAPKTQTLPSKSERPVAQEPKKREGSVSEERPLFDMGDLGTALDTAAVPIISNSDLVAYETSHHKAVDVDKRAPVGDGSLSLKGAFNVVVPKTAKPGAAALVAEYMKISQAEAQKHLCKPFTFVTKGIDKSRAMEVAKAFKAKGIATRITRSKS